MKEVLIDFDDLIIIPEILSDISSRKEVNTKDKYGMLPLFTAPMDTVVNEDNADKFIDNKIYSIIPRKMNSCDTSCTPFKWYAYGLEEFENMFLNKVLSVEENENAKFYALIDIANGHMKRLYELAKKAKEMYSDRLVLMVGNVANPQTYEEFAKIGVDYIRLGIGNGAGCLTTQQTGIGYPMASLIAETYKIKEYRNYQTKIVADGGMQKFADIIKALALGADYVMLGSMLNKALESAGALYFKESNGEFVYFYSKGTYHHSNIERYRKEGLLYKEYRGMSTKKVQQSWGRTECKTSEGISKFNPVEYTLSGWCQNFNDYLASAMSYTNSYTLEDFKKSEIKQISVNSFKRFNK